MAKKFNASQFRSKLNQIKSKQKTAINKFNQKVREHNRKVNQAVNQYNQAVLQHNARVRANRQRLNAAIVKMNSQNSVRYTVTASSSYRLYQSFEQLDERFESGFLGDQYGEFVDMAEREAANSTELSNALNSSAQAMDYFGPAITTSITSELKKVSDDLDQRWKGAIFSLNPNNPDAARHFCTSSREVIIQLIDLKAPDEVVKTKFPSIQLTDNGKPTRRSKIEYLLKLNKREELIDFTDTNIDDIQKLFREFNNGTHGTAGRYSYDQLLKLKNRVEDTILYLYEVAYN